MGFEGGCPVSKPKESVPGRFRRASRFITMVVDGHLGKVRQRVTTKLQALRRRSAPQPEPTTEPREHHIELKPGERIIGHVKIHDEHGPIQWPVISRGATTEPLLPAPRETRSVAPPRYEVPPTWFLIVGLVLVACVVILGLYLAGS